MAKITITDKARIIAALAAELNTWIKAGDDLHPGLDQEGEQQNRDLNGAGQPIA